MNTGKPLFAQLMEFPPWTAYTRIVERYGHRMRTLSRTEQYRAMAFAHEPPRFNPFGFCSSGSRHARSPPVPA